MILALLMLMTARLLPAAVLAIAGLSLLGYLRWPFARNAAAGPKRFRTRLLDVEIGGDAIRGRVVAGRFARRTLGSLSAHDLGALWREARLKDPGGVQIVEALLDRLDPRWRELHGSADAAKPHVNLADAYNILGLSPGATRDDVVRAHREMMKRVHPDQGGSNYLAAKINEAKTVLLDQLG
jgi:DnaJ-domain-containing protein 1